MLIRYWGKEVGEAYTQVPIKSQNRVSGGNSSHHLLTGKLMLRRQLSNDERKEQDTSWDCVSYSLLEPQVLVWSTGPHVMSSACVPCSDVIIYNTTYPTLNIHMFRYDFKYHMFKCDYMYHKFRFDETHHVLGMDTHIPHSPACIPCVQLYHLYHLLSYECIHSHILYGWVNRKGLSLEGNSEWINLLRAFFAARAH